ncbi:MAG TPA: serine/threonine-protein kinase [Flavobacterium sp.]|nr:serine/threonine-protein kinase [Flavobacterium sp.]
MDTSESSQSLPEMNLPIYEQIGGEFLDLDFSSPWPRKTAHAEVWKAQDKNLGRTVAAKVIKCPSDPQSLKKAWARIHREANSWMEFEKDGAPILPLYELRKHKIHTADGEFVVFIFIMQFSEIGDLKNYIREKASKGLELSKSNLRRFMRDIAEAIRAGHDRAKLHKDIKASNVLLFSPGKGPDGKFILNPKLSDFGISQNLLENSHGREGTPEYMAPEAFDALYSPDKPSDIYSLGILFYEIILGKLPYKTRAASPTERFNEYETLHKSGDIPSFDDIEKKIDKEMVALLRWMLRIQLKERKRPTIVQVIDELDKQIAFAAHAEVTHEETQKLPRHRFRWNPFVHERLGEKLRYFFIRGRNPKTDDEWLKNNLREKGILGFSLYRVVGGIDYILRVWVRPNSTTEKIVDEVVADFNRHGFSTTFKVSGIHAVASTSLSRYKDFKEANVAELIHRCLDNNGEKSGSEFERLKDAELVAASVDNDPLVLQFPLRFFISFEIRGSSPGMFKFFAGEIFEKLKPFENNGSTASISVYFGDHERGLPGSPERVPGLLVKLRLKRFEDYEMIWHMFLDALTEIDASLQITSQSFIELNRHPIHESDDGWIWSAVEEYRKEYGSNF